MGFYCLAVIMPILGWVCVACSGLMMTSLWQVITRPDASFLSGLLIHKLGMGTIPIPSIDTVDTCELGVSIDTSTMQVSLVFDTEPALFMVSMYVWKPQENVNQSEEKAENANFFSGSFLMKSDQGKLINRVSDRIFHSSLKPFWKRL